MYKEDLALNKLQWLIFHKPNQTKDGNTKEILERTRQYNEVIGEETIWGEVKNLVMDRIDNVNISVMKYSSNC